MPKLVKTCLGLTVRSTTLRNRTQEKVAHQLLDCPRMEAKTLASRLKALSETHAGVPTREEQEGVLRSSLVAGTDPIATTLARAIWYLHRDPVLQERLLNQLAGKLCPGLHLDPTPLLRNVVKETLRCHSPFGHSLPRVAPAGGMAIEDYFVPAGVSFSPHDVAELTDTRRPMSRPIHGRYITAQRTFRIRQVSSPRDGAVLKLVRCASTPDILRGNQTDGKQINPSLRSVKAPGVAWECVSRLHHSTC